MELRIKEIIKEKKLTTVWLADKLEISRPAMSNIVNSKVSPSLNTLEKIASALEVQISELFDKPSNTIINCPNCGAELELRKK
ncbi:MAG: helix-turn-helix transcriptional regulator [Paludibacter sp.]|nr:helix-turn-helix transcriptional regulator [Paludibacter sp.]